MRRLPFVKYQGLGNDFIMFLATDVNGLDLAALAQKVCNRHFGIGADGMVVLAKGQDLRMDFYNSDGSQAPMCGNASRCVAKWAKEQGLINADSFILQTMGGDLAISYQKDGLVSVNLGQPKLTPQDIPALWSGENMIDVPVIIDGKEVILTALFMATTHAVVFVHELNEEEVLTVGPKIENLNIFPSKTNVNFVQIIDSKTVRQITWERGAGRTLACGTGACATAVAGNLTNRFCDQVRVIMDGGELLISYKENQGVIMTGQAQKIAEGEYYYHQL